MVYQEFSTSPMTRDILWLMVSPTHDVYPSSADIVSGSRIKMLLGQSSVEPSKRRVDVNVGQVVTQAKDVVERAGARLCVPTLQVRRKPSLS